METVTFSRAAKVTAAVFGALMIGLLLLNNLQIGAQLKVVEQQRDFQAQSDPLVRDGRLLAEDARDRLPQTRRAARDAAALVRATRPLVDDLDRVDVEDVLTAAGSLAQGLSAQNRLVRLVDRSDRLIGHIEEAGFIDSATRAARRTPDFMDEILRIQRETRELQRQALAVQRQTLAIQKEALIHVRSLDRKSGGTAPASAGSPARLR